MILAIALHKSQHNVTSMQLKAVDVTNVAVMTISSRTALLIEIMTKKTVVSPMVNRNTTMITDQNQMMRILLRNQCQSVINLLRSLLKQNKPFHIVHLANPHIDINGKTENSDHKPSYLHPASICKLYQEDNTGWDQVLDQILFTYQCCPHISTGEAPYTLLYFRDPPLPIHKLIQPIEPYKGDDPLPKQIEKT